MNIIGLDDGYRFKLESMPRGAHKSQPITHRCNRPSRVVTVDFNGNCLVCSCDGWLPVPVGQVQDFSTLDSVWASSRAQMLQQDIDQGRFTWCAVEHCGIKHNDIDHGMYELAINIDESCNLSCASCRRDTIMHTTGAVVEKKQQDMQRILEWLEDFDRPLHVVTSGNGDPLASVVMRKFLQNYQPRPAQFWTMFTNGLLIKKQLERLPVLAAIKNFRISVDAARADTYARVRRGGHWPTLMENFEFLQNFDGDFEVTVNFCVQQANYQEIPEFIALCQTHGFKPHIHELDDWGTWDRFHEHNVLDLRHPDHVACRNIVESSLGKNHKRRWFFSTRLLELLSLT